MEQSQKLAMQVEASKHLSMHQMEITKIKDKTPNPHQMTAEQLISDHEIHKLDNITMPIQTTLDSEEVEGYKNKKRKEFEESLRRQRFHLGLWIRYAEWEGTLQEFRRARSIFERALDVSPNTPSLWMRYVEFEMKNKFLNHARNIFERATTYMPRVDQFWYKYIYMEEALGNYQKAREIFKKWTDWNPIPEAWIAYSTFEMRMKEYHNSRVIMYEFLDKNPKIESYLLVAKFEERSARFKNSRQICERAFKEIGNEAINEEFLLYWTKLEEKTKEIERAFQLFEFGLKNLPDANSDRLKSEFVRFKAKFGKENDISEIVFEKRRRIYRAKLEQNNRDFESWMSLAMLEQEANNFENMFSVLTQSHQFQPQSTHKGDWKKYVFMFLVHAGLVEEIESNSGRSIAILEECIQLIPHKNFSFSKVWIELAKIYIRRDDIQAARLVLGRAIGNHPSLKVFQFYLEIESKLGNFDRCRKLHERNIELNPNSSDNWIAYFNLEVEIGEYERARKIIRQTLDLSFLDNLELVWKTAIDFEIGQQNDLEVAHLYNTLLERTKHVKVFVSFALFYFSNSQFDKMRSTFEEAEVLYRKEKMNEERAIVVDNWFNCELQIGEKEHIQNVQSKLPKKIKKQRVLGEGDSIYDNDVQIEEYIEYVFNDMDNVKRLSNLQKQAHLYQDKK